MHVIVLNVGALIAAAAGFGVIGEEALVEYLGVALFPVTMELVCAVIVRLPVRGVDIFRVENLSAHPEPAAVHSQHERGPVDRDPELSGVSRADGAGRRCVVVRGLPHLNAPVVAA